MKLAGLRVVDLSTFLPGPYLTLLLADHGAEVIKIEPPGGDPGRAIGPFEDGMSVFFRNVNRGKKSVVLDLKQDASRARLLALAATADVFVESFRPGVAARLGVDYPRLCAKSPGIVYCSIAAFGQTGPHPHRPAHDLAIEAQSGALSVTRGNDDQPAIPGVPTADIVAGLQGLAAVLMALLRRAETGEGDHIDISMQDAMLSASVNVLGPALAGKRQQTAKLERSTGGAAFYRIYGTADGRHLVLGGQEEKFVRAFLEKLGRPDLIEPCLRGPGAHQAPVIAFLEALFRTKPLAAWVEELVALDLCFGPVLDFPEVLADPQLRARGTVLEDARGRRHIASPIRFAAEPARPDLEAPALGRDTDAVLDALAREPARSRRS